MNKKKIINDPLYGFITITSELIFDIINHPFVQRLRRIRQLGLSEYVYPGALHTRFHHALGSMHLMNEALESLRKKGIDISNEEFEAALIAVLLHDVGHSPFSHALEHHLVDGANHEQISIIVIEELNRQLNGQLDLALAIFKGEYSRRFFHQLVSSQLDIDRLDYLNRDSFFTGVIEGQISSERIIKLLNVRNDELVVDEKGIYSIENFLSARRLMYWQVYLHKTTVGIEAMLRLIVNRGKKIHHERHVPRAISPCISQRITAQMLKNDHGLLTALGDIDDYDIVGAIKEWVHADDPVLSRLCQMLLERKLFNVLLMERPVGPEMLDGLKLEVKELWALKDDETGYFVLTGMKSNAAYIGGDHKINILTKSGRIVDVALASDLPNIMAMRKIVKKYYLCWPKNITLQDILV